MVDDNKPLIAGRPRKRRSAYGRGVSVVGKSTRMLYDSHDAARKGERVVVECASRVRAFHLLQRLKSIGFGCEVRFEMSGRRIFYPSGVELYLRAPDDPKPDPEMST